jgi:hypothetical protein
MPLEDAVPLLRFTMSGFYIQGHSYYPGLLAGVVFFCTIALILDAFMQKPKAGQPMLARLVRLVPFFLLTAMIICCNIYMAILSSAAEQGKGFLLIFPPIFNLIFALFILALTYFRITASARWLGLMWVGFSTLQAGLLYVLIANAAGNGWSIGPMILAAWSIGLLSIVRGLIWA